jgi:hypothetical protein
MRGAPIRKTVRIHTGILEKILTDQNPNQPETGNVSPTGPTCPSMVFRIEPYVPPRSIRIMAAGLRLVIAP